MQMCAQESDKILEDMGQKWVFYCKAFLLWTVLSTVSMHCHLLSTCCCLEFIHMLAQASHHCIS